MRTLPTALILTLSLLFCCDTTLLAQEYLFDAQHFTTNDGLANLTTTTIFKDSQGFLWISTQYGLNRYDGYTFQLFTKEKNGLFNNKDVRDIKEDQAGNLWLFYVNFSKDGIEQKWAHNIDIFNPLTKKVIPFDQYFKQAAPFRAAAATILKINDPKKRFWIATSSGQLFLYQKNTFKKIFEQPGMLFQYLTIDQVDNIYLGGKDQLIKINTKGEVLESLKLSGQISGLWTGENDQLWLNTFVLNEKNKKDFSIWSKAKNDAHLAPFTLTKNGKALPTGRQVIRTQDGLWYVAIDKGFHVFSSKGEWMFDFHSLLGNEFGPGFIDFHETEKHLWLAKSVGIVKISVKPNPFHLIHSREIFSDCRSITEDEAGNVYFLNALAYQWSPLNQKLEELPDMKGSMGLIYKDSTLWVGLYSGAILGYQKDFKTNQQTNYASLGYGQILTALETDAKDRFLTGHEKGLAYLDLKEKKQLPFHRYNGFDQLREAKVYDFHQNKTGIWIASEIGLFLMDKEKGIVQHFNKASGDLPFDYIQHIHEDETGLFWLATRGGGIIQWQGFKNKDQQLHYRQFTTKNGLSNNYTYAIYGDDYGKLWISSDKGLMCLDKSTYEVKTYLIEDGLPHNEFNLTAHYQTQNGRLYFGGLGGLITFHPKDFANTAKNQTPLEFIGYYLLEEGAEEMTDKTGLLNKSNEIIIKPTDKLFELRFALMDYDNSKHHAYEYNIEGYTNHWNRINENYLRITNLPPGEYTLKIRGQNDSDGWSEQELALRIRVLKPFYLQGWFIFLLIMCGIGTTVAIIRRREIKLEKDRERLETEVQKRTLTIQQQAEELKTLDEVKTRFFSNITHEFRTPLTLIIGPLEQIILEQSTPTILKKRLNGVFKNSQHLLSLINQMLDLSKIESGRMMIEMTRGDIVYYTRELVKRFHPIACRREQRLHFIADQEKWETNFDENKWNKIVCNLLSNALKFTPSGKAIQLSLTRGQKNGEECMRLDVKDTGIGIEGNQLRQVFNRFYQADSSSTRQQDGTGIGLALVKELVELQGGEIQVSSALDKGTSFVVQLPILHAEHVAPLVTETIQKPCILPIVTEEIQEPSMKIATVKDKEKLELLIIEDNEEMREYIRYCLAPSEYNISEANNGEEGLQKAQALIPDLIISDVMMPKKNGFELTQAIRSNISTSHIPLILLTAKAALESRLEGLKKGADAYLTKPFSPQELTLRIKQLIEVRQALQQRYQNELPTTTADTYQQEDTFITELRQFILQHLDESDLNGDRIGKHFGISRVHLHRKLKALTNQPITAFVRSIRLKKAEELIQEGQLNISEVAWQTGFTSISHFSRSFKKSYGKAPSKM